MDEFKAENGNNNDFSIQSEQALNASGDSLSSISLRESKELKSKYDELYSDYRSLKAKYDALESKVLHLNLEKDVLHNKLTLYSKPQMELRFHSHIIDHKYFMLTYSFCVVLIVIQS